MVLLQELPIEITLVIISQLDETNDLLSLALTNRAQCSLIIPDCLYCCRINCNIYSFKTWRLLNENPGLCIHCKDLTVSTIKVSGMSRVGLIPRLLIQDDGGVCEPSFSTRSELALQHMNKAVSLMGNLSRLSLRIRGGWWKDKKNFEGLSHALLKSRCVLSHLVLLCAGAKTDRIGINIILQPHLCMSLSKFSLSDLVHGFDRTEEDAYVDIITSLNSRAQNLTHLYLKLAAVSSTVGYMIVSRGYWPKLQHLSLPGFGIVSPIGSAKDWQNRVQIFLERHVHLQTLILPNYMFHSGTIIESGEMLSNLHGLELDNVQDPTVRFLDQIPTRILENLSHLTITTGSRRLPRSGLSITALEILHRVPQLQSCILNYSEHDGENFVMRAIEFLVEGSPFLQKLCIKVYSAQPPVELVLPLLKDFKYLTHLIGFTTYVSDEILRQIDGHGFLSTQKDFFISARLPHNQEDFANCNILRLFRDDKTDRVEYEVVPHWKVRYMDFDYNTWGGFYQGI